MSELIDTPLATVNGDKSAIKEGGTYTVEDYRTVLESNIHKLEAKKKREIKRTKKIYEELKRAKEENEILKNTVDELMKKLKSNQVQLSVKCDNKQYYVIDKLLNMYVKCALVIDTGVNTFE